MKGSWSILIYWLQLTKPDLVRFDRLICIADIKICYPKCWFVVKIIWLDFTLLLNLMEWFACLNDLFVA